jgi:hypothetical protein
VKQIPADCINVSGGLLGDMHKHVLVVAKEIENVQLGNAMLSRKGVKCANVQIYCVWCPSTRVTF